MAVVRSVPIVLAMALGLALVGCSGGDDGTDLGPAASAPTASPAASTIATDPAPTTATVGADPFAIPDVIDAAYVNRVLAALYAVDGDLLRLIVAERMIGAEVITKIGDIFGEPQLSRELRLLPDLLEGDPGRFRNPPGDRRVLVASMITVRRDCILALVESDFSAVVHSPEVKDPATVGLMALVPTPARIRAREVNPTPWYVVRSERIARSEAPEGSTPCV